MKFSVEKQIDILEQFIGGRYIDDETIDFYSDKFEKIDETIYRGMPFPKHLINEGYIMEEWHGSSHWTLDFKVARDRFSSDNFNINEDYAEELSIEFNISYEDACKLFVPVVLRLQGVSRGARSYSIVKNLDIVSRFYSEKEITTMGINTVIKNIEIKSDENGEYYMIDVEEI